MKHASVRIDNWNIPLIGIPPSATIQACTKCGMDRHLQDVVLDHDGNPVCRNCLTDKKLGKKPVRKT
jgi:hypothetical protein